jgi:hypothetical protein
LGVATAKVGKQTRNVALPVRVIHRLLTTVLN